MMTPFCSTHCDNAFRQCNAVLGNGGSRRVGWWGQTWCSTPSLFEGRRHARGPTSCTPVDRFSDSDHPTPAPSRNILPVVCRRRRHFHRCASAPESHRRSLAPVPRAIDQLQLYSTTRLVGPAHCLLPRRRWSRRRALLAFSPRPPGRGREASGPGPGSSRESWWNCAQCRNGDALPGAGHQTACRPGWFLDEDHSQGRQDAARPAAGARGLSHQR